MSGGEIVLFLVAAAGIVGDNTLIAIAAAGMLGLRVLGVEALYALFDHYAVSAGVLLLTAGLLLPFSTGSLGFEAVVRTFTSPSGIIAVAVGAVASFLGTGGIELLTSRPEVMVGLVVGTIVGVAAFGGVPVGPLVAAGFTALLYQLLKV